MARKLRLEFPGACYHVINRGNYQANIFRADSTKAAFESCLFEACRKSSWRLHAFVVMRNHYHLAVETPDGNLVAGMQWLQATFAARFNRRRGLHGHLFQGRYKAFVVEAGEPFAEVGVGPKGSGFSRPPAKTANGKVTLGGRPRAKEQGGVEAWRANCGSNSPGRVTT